MILSLFGLAVAATFQAISDFLLAVLPTDAFEAVQSITEPLAFLVPPTFAATVPVVLTAFFALGATRLFLNLLGRK